ncbi:and other transporter-domain-containing protein [Aspergillus welwitschiae]|uniref:And other transporter-domain-containing protein n=1 Tax=Aspergillus welwitschiae TaxID=1341132 RepID=A0A3F3Q8U1_9EURO|nr:and other transporter-domain-containing protein [Aspergillus welwitschiae]RDH35620.1 and other transporter-domain-containing protein [Aspergillus welwitschiae]
MDPADDYVPAIDDLKPETFHVDNLGAAEGLDDSIETTNPGKAVWLIACTVSMGGFLFGYDTGVISAVLVSLGTDLGQALSSNDQELVTSITSGGALIGAVLAGMTSDKYGRKLAIYIGCAVFFVGTALQATAFSLAQMVVGRLVVGFGVGEAAMIVPLYIGEMAPARFRGRLIVFDNICVTFGQLIAYALGAAFTNVHQGWRYTIAIGAVPAIALAATMPLCPETPRQLISHGRDDEAKRVIRKIFPHATEQQVVNKIKVVRHSIEEVAASVSDKSLWWQMKQLFTVGANLRALATACSIMAVSQLGGFNTLMYYSATLFSLVGFNQATAVSIVVGATNFVFGFPNFAFIDRFGRRSMLLVTVLGMSLSLVVVAIAFHWIPVNSDLSVTGPHEMTWASILLLVALIVYIAFYSAGVAPISWVGTEFLPLEVRALGTMLNTVTCWGCNIIISSTFLSMMKAMTPSGVFAFYAGICFLGWVFVIFCYAEVHNMPLESVREIYTHGFGVRHAKRLQRELREARANEQKTLDPPRLQASAVGSSPGGSALEYCRISSAILSEAESDVQTGSGPSAVATEDQKGQHTSTTMAHSPFARELQVACLAVQRASIVTKTMLAEADKGSTDKADASPVTIADFASQAILISAIRHNFPSDKFVGEESASALRNDPALADRVWQLVSTTQLHDTESEEIVAAPSSLEEMLSIIDLGGNGEGAGHTRTWILDPIDGTASFIQGRQYAVSVALVDKGEQKVGVVGYPNLHFHSTVVHEDTVDRDGYGIMLSAIRGQGTYKRQMSKERLQPAVKVYNVLARTDTGQPDLAFAESMESPYIDQRLHQVVRERLGVTRPVTDLWSMQAKYAALVVGGCNVMVRIPRSPEYRAYAWDHAGGMLVYEESGGMITDLDGQPFNYGRGRTLADNLGLVATFPDIHSTVLGLAREIRGRREEDGMKDNTQ